jgi:small subunit ribosomal protein S4
MHGRQRSKPTEYGIQLREKQKMRRYYGVLERQFRNYFERAARTKGVTGDTLVTLLEARLDNVICNAGFAQSRKTARQLVSHGMININGRRAAIASRQIKVGDVISVRSERARTKIRGELQANESFVGPEWISVDRENMTATITRLPQPSDVRTPFNVSLVVELYSK